MSFLDTSLNPLSQSFENDALPLILPTVMEHIKI